MLVPARQCLAPSRSGRVYGACFIATEGVRHALKHGRSASAGCSLRILFSVKCSSQAITMRTENGRVCGVCAGGESGTMASCDYRFMDHEWRNGGSPPTQDASVETCGHRASCRLQYQLPKVASAWRASASAGAPRSRHSCRAEILPAQRTCAAIFVSRLPQ